MTATITQLRKAEPVTITRAIDAYLANALGGKDSAGTRRVFGSILCRLAKHSGEETAVGDLGQDQVAEWVSAEFGECSASRWNSAYNAIHLAGAYWAEQDWVAENPAARLRRQRVPDDRSRALSHAEVGALLKSKNTGLREKTLWTMLYETAARSAEVLSLNVEDLDMPNHCAKVRRKGGATDVIVWQTGTATLLPRLLKGRKSGPLFVTARRARVPLPAADLDPGGHARLSYQQAEDLFKKASGGRTLHQLRHSALTHEAEKGTSTPMLMARSGHTSVRSLQRYARVSVEALQRHQAESDPASRRYHH
jgi:integrase